MDFVCPRCDYSTDMKSSMKTHINRKKICKCTKDDVIIKDYEESILNKRYIIENKTIPCTCGANFINKEEHYKHVINCKKEFDIIKNKNKELEKELELLKLAANTSVKGNNNTVHSNNIILNIQLTPYNDPNIENTKKYFKEAIKKAFLSVPTLIERIHFNDELPENKNILISNFRNKIAKVFDGKKWKTMNEDELIDELICVNERALQDFAEEYPENQKYIDKYNEIKERDGEEKVNDDIKIEVKKILYDNRGMINVKTKLT
jgi:hypothetical protein